MSVAEAIPNMEHWQERVDLAAAFRWTVRLNMHEAVANHFSLAINDDGTKFLMNPNQMHFSRIKASDLIVVDANDPDTLEGPEAPDPTAWGLHGGLHRAFKVRAKGLVKTEEYVDAATFTEGCDTIFVLSDGKPTWDDWPEWDLRLAKHKSGDPESGAETKDHEKGHYYGPYALGSWLRDDLRRLNLFRKAEIHCVGIGEHDPHLLRWIAGRGLGRFRKVPADE